MDVWMWVVIALFAVMGVLILLGKGDFLVFVRNRKRMEKYHVHRVRLIYGIGVLLITAWFIVFGRINRPFPQGLLSWAIAIEVALLGMTILRETMCRK